MLRVFVLVAACFFATSAFADGDEYGFGFFSSKRGVEAVNNDLYRSSCAECHFEYQAGLLPKRSWQKMMLPNELENHFGDNAEPEESDREKVLAYLVEHAADNSEYKRSVKMMRSIKDDATPLRITEVRYFKRKHDEVPSRLVVGNAKVRSWANCAACHTAAEKGSYSDDDVRIPGYGRWDD